MAKKDNRKLPESEVQPEPDDTVIPEEDADDPDATVGDLDSTLGIEPSESAEGTPAERELLDTTVAEAKVDETVEMDGSARRPIVIRGGPAGGKTQQSGGGHDLQEDTTVPGSILNSRNIGETVNPRDLSGEDATLWNSAVGQPKDDPSVLPPAIERTFSDQQFDRLRQCDVAPLKSDPDKVSDYRLVRKLGQGGMGDVFVARQGSLDRLLALKLIKPLGGKKRIQLEKTGKLDQVEEERRQQFLSEAIVTGDLDHPNIVPIHDVALTSRGELFYSMKRVVGTPWSKVIKQHTRDENIEILLKAADAIGFAHTRGVVHRDIKPENIMLGDFGVVMVMDWGLALPTSTYERQDSVFATSGLGGTPAFMAPEMATGPLEAIGPASDIYLLGATLFMIVTGAAPHHGKNVTDCLKAVRTNAIREVPEHQRGELLDIAIKAMATRPEDRFEDVESFQKAIRSYREHSESIALATRAADDLQRGKENRSYSDLSRAAFGFEQAIKSWSENEKAHRGAAETKLVHADAAYENGDFDLGLSLLDENIPEHQPIIMKLRDGLRERQSHAARLSLMRKIAAAMLAVIIIGGSVAMYLINAKRREAEVAQAEATEARDAATMALAAEQQAKNQAQAAAQAEKAAKEEAIASEDRTKQALAKEQAALAKEKAALLKEELAKQEAIAAAQAEKKARQELKQSLVKEEQARKNADEAKELALAAQQKAESSRRRAEYEEYVSKIGLAKARLERNEADGAREILRQLRDRPQSRDRTDGWEWRWLWRQANQSESTVQADAALIDLSIAPSGRRGVVATSDGGVDLLRLSEDGRLSGRESLTARLPAAAHAKSVAISPDETSVAVGTASGDILLVDLDVRSPKKTTLKGHRRQITDLQYCSNGMLVSGSADKTVRVWDTKTHAELTREQACWHISPVRQIAVSGAGSSVILAVAISDNVTGQVAIWDLRRKGDGVAVDRRGTLTDHRHPLSSVAITVDGRLVASGDVAGNVLIFDPSDVASIDHARSIKDALAAIDRQDQKPDSSRQTRSAPLVDASPESERRLVSTARARAGQRRAHDDVVKAIRFSKDGKSLVTSSDDYTLKLWDVAAGQVRKTLKGHGGWVVGAEFLRGSSDVIVSASSDATVRSWRPGQYVGAYRVHRIAGEQPQAEARETKAHGQEVWSASFSADGSKVVTASHDHTARVMEIDKETLSFKKVTRLEDELLSEGTSFVAMSFQVDRQHNRLYIGSADATIRLWDLEVGTEIGQASGTGLNAAFAVSKSGRLMLTGSSLPEAKAILWRLDPDGTSSPRVIARMAGHQQAVTTFAISPDSELLFTGDRSGYGLLWDARTGKPTGTPVENVRGYRINAAIFSDDSRKLLIASDDQQLTVIDVQSRNVIGRMNHDGFVTGLSLSSDGRQALTVSELTTRTQFRSTATLWNLDTGKGRVLDRVIDVRRESSGSGNRQRITSAHFDDAGQTAAVCRTADGGKRATVGVWDVRRVRDDSDTKRPASRNASVLASLQPGSAAARADRSFELPEILGTAEGLRPLDGRSLLTMNKNGVFKWDLATGRLIKSYRAHAELTEACFSFDTRFVATASRSVKIWDADTGRAIAKLESPRPIRTVQFAPAPLAAKQYVLATGGEEGIARLWTFDPEARTFTSLEPDKIGDADPAHDRIIRRVRFSPRGDRLLIVGDGGLARIRDLKQARASVSLPGAGTASFRSAAFSSDGTTIAAAGMDKRVRIWQVPKPGAKPGAPIVLDGHADTVNDVVLYGETRQRVRVMTASSDDTARIWDPRLDATDEQQQHTGPREILSLRRHTGDVTAVDITADGTLLMTAGRDGLVILWPADPPQPNLFEAL